MAGEEPQDYAVDLENFRQFLLDRKVREDCELCHSSAWRFIGNFKDTLVSLPFSANTGQLDTNIRLPGILRICENCGNVKFHGLNQYLTWKTARKAESPNDG